MYVRSDGVGIGHATQPTKTLQTGECLILYRGWKPLPQVVCRDSEIAATEFGEDRSTQPTKTIEISRRQKSVGFRYIHFGMRVVRVFRA